MNHAEIAEIMDVTETVTRTLLFRGKNKVKEVLKSRKNVTRS